MSADFLLNLGGTVWINSSPQVGREFLYLRRITMAKRKRGGRKGFSLSAFKDYRSDEFVPYIMRAEMGLLQAGQVDPTLTDGEVSQALTELMRQLEQPEALQRWLAEPETDEADPLTINTEAKSDFIHRLIFMNLQDAFAQEGPISAEDVSGILKVIRTSVKRWGHGDHRRGYLTYIEGFLGQMGVQTQLLTEEEFEELGVEPHLIDDGDNDE
jgi:hypothetical protein